MLKVFDEFKTKCLDYPFLSALVIDENIVTYLDLERNKLKFIEAMKEAVEKYKNAKHRLAIELQ